MMSEQRRWAKRLPTLTALAVIVVAAIGTATVLGSREPTAIGSSPSGSPTASASLASLPAESSAATASAPTEAGPDEPPVWIPDQPPQVSINGVIGEPFSWCYGNACMHGAPWLAPLDALPMVRLTLPLSVLMGEAGLVEGGQVLREWEGGGELPIEPVAVANGTLSIVPPGDWTRLVVSVRFDGGGSATYVWALEQ